MRSGSAVWINVDIYAAMADGIEFFLSDNGVVLTKGEGGVLAPRYFKSIVFRDG